MVVIIISLLLLLLLQRLFVDASRNVINIYSRQADDNNYSRDAVEPNNRTHNIIVAAAAAPSPLTGANVPNASTTLGEFRCRTIGCKTQKKIKPFCTAAMTRVIFSRVSPNPPPTV